MNMMGHSRHRRNFPSGTRSKTSHSTTPINAANSVHSYGHPSTPKSIGTPSRSSSRGCTSHHGTNPRYIFWLYLIIFMCYTIHLKCLRNIDISFIYLQGDSSKYTSPRQTKFWKQRRKLYIEEYSHHKSIIWLGLNRYFYVNSEMDASNDLFALKLKWNFVWF